MVVPKKNGKFKIYLDFRKFNATTKKNPYSLPFANEVFNIIVGHDAYSFLDGYFGYHHISITLEDIYKTMFVTNWRTFIWVVIPFGVKNNGPPTYHKVVSRSFKYYLDIFMKIFLYDFIMYNDVDIHLVKFKLCFQKCKIFWINLNPNKCAFMVFSRMILGFIVSKEGKLPYPNEF